MSCIPYKVTATDINGWALLHRVKDNYYPSSPSDQSSNINSVSMLVDKRSELCPVSNDCLIDVASSGFRISIIK